VWHLTARKDERVQSLRLRKVKFMSQEIPREGREVLWDQCVIESLRRNGNASDATKCADEVLTARDAKFKPKP
jgi:hypothetical protein